MNNKVSIATIFFSYMKKRETGGNPTVTDTMFQKHGINFVIPLSVFPEQPGYYAAYVPICHRGF